MSDVEYSEDPEPSERVPAGPLLVPVRSGPAGCSARLFRTPLGDRTAVGFTSEAGLAATLGPDHACVRLSEPALRALVAPLGVTALTVDPQFAASGVSKPRGVSKPGGGEGSWRTWDPRHVGALRVAGVAAVIACINLLTG
ncbi:SAV_915 family protein [Streptomyces sp. NPDC059695]|uniref:SAV_915 family protein n=1 Tax=Streptomyces sp. NPDC059695 TaxID=3346910 RepID=UPI0036B29263